MNSKFVYNKLSEEQIEKMVEESRALIEDNYNFMVPGIECRVDAVRLVNLYRNRFNISCSIIGKESPYAVNVQGQKY